MDNIQYRKDLPALLPFESVGVELGVFEGTYSQELWSSEKFKELHLVDPFEGKIGSGDKDGLNYKNLKGDYLYKINKANFSEFNNVHIHRQKSIPFLKETADDVFNFVYIDTTHVYKDTLDELKESFRTIKNGGILAGHDLNLDGSGVKMALADFCAEYKQKFSVVYGDKLHSFYIKVNK